ncbi:nucleotidyltransferase family protein [Sphingomonas crocodyli]|uniref:Nucleotidyltransferase family protein n=1 Tax=Sphingomonas crocodyli TaxID=1979270 RepID=A0A437LV30_9SPHN|nr:nucleotidyltransferase family protein [Sphingomonas crocodyli]RVT89227.1 nucleotidyltransferase family protein [Sphingomonas crocodyli]
MTIRKPLVLRPNPTKPPVGAAMILAAGLGKRMRPLTATRPKPLVEVAGQSLLDHVLDRLRAAGIGNVVVNVHYLADALEAHLKRKAGDLNVAISDERGKLLETGGGVLKALPMIDADPFLIANSDNLWVDGPVDAIRLLADRWDDATMDALLLLVPLARANCHSGQGDFHMGPDGVIARRKPAKVAPFVYTGVQLVSKRLFEGVEEGNFSFNLLWNRAIAAGRAYGVVHQGLWFDVGSPPSIGKTEELLGRN